MSKVLIIGGGAAGMMAGVFAARNHHEVHILEKNEKLGKKVFITGKGRCNVANACDAEELFPAVMSNPKFLYSGFYSFGPQDVMDFFKYRQAQQTKVDEKAADKKNGAYPV